MLLPTFTYTPPVLDASNAVVLNSILIEELNANYKSVNKFRIYLKSPFLFIITGMIVAGIVSITLPFYSLGPVSFLFSMFIAVVLALYGFISILIYIKQQILPNVFSKLKQDTILSRNTAIANWVEARYGVEVSLANVSTLFSKYEAEKDTLVRVGGSLVRFQTVNGEGQLLFDSAGLELKVLVPVS